MAAPSHKHFFHLYNDNQPSFQFPPKSSLPLKCFSLPNRSLLATFPARCMPPFCSVPATLTAGCMSSPLLHTATATPACTICKSARFMLQHLHPSTSA